VKIGYEKYFLILLEKSLKIRTFNFLTFYIFNEVARKSNYNFIQNKIYPILDELKIDF
jgi:hypothetical protein